jgi:hypothetical protein
MPDPNWLTADRLKAYAVVNKDLAPIDIKEVYKQQQEEYSNSQLKRRRTYNGYQGRKQQKATPPQTPLTL